uniref:Thrombospondin-like N-terminal domain-containing protein n=1 Tax=Astatotilapia calliptera TaxID=8154 RepID=A0A3P8PIZ1_ASTCA
FKNFQLLFFSNPLIIPGILQCSLPLDLLSFVLERDPSKLVPGVHMKQAGGVRGIHFSSPDTALSFPSSQILVNCDLFPKEFSIVLTLKVSDSAPKVKEQHSQKTRVKSDGRLILGLKFSGKRLHFLYKGHRGVVEHWVFRGTQLADSQWHTLVLAIGSHHVKLTVDCSSPVEIIPSRPFPSDLNIQGSRFHIGSRGLWKGLFSGLLRQLVLVPGSDATHQICPSSDPQLAALSVPPLFLDLPATGAEDDRHGNTYETEARVSVGLEKSCSEQLQGQLWFNPLKKGLYLCDGTVWITVLEDRKRLDYVLEHQVLTTSSETHDIELFQVPGMGLMAAMAHRSASGSAVYLWTKTGFQLYQNISTNGALAWRHFSMGNKVRFNKDSQADFSVIYKWSKRRKRFVQFQTLQTHCARDWEAFNIDGHTYLAVANHRQGDKNHTIDSVIYRWNRLSKSFEVHQMLQTSGAYDWEFFTVGPYYFLVVANAFDGVTTSLDSVIYVWVNGNFQVFQKIKVCDKNNVKCPPYCLLVSALKPSQTSHTHNSNIDLLSYRESRWKYCTNGIHLFCFAFRWQGYEGFVPVHWLPTIGCSDWEFFSAKGESYLIYSSAKAPLSKVFMLKTY